RGRSLVQMKSMRHLNSMPAARVLLKKA
ncbi:TPA: DUF262 domain-containing protein, partial [Escherichia coli]|nr:DUF262 domain-containing protein [Escherichia coli]